MLLLGGSADCWDGLFLGTVDCGLATWDGLVLGSADCKLATLGGLVLALVGCSRLLVEDWCSR